jgi:hypothetical protein
MNSVTVSHSPIPEITTKIEDRQAYVGVIGLGYVGLPLSLLYVAQKVPSHRS